MDELLTIPDVARILGVNPNTLTWLYRQGVLPAQKRIGVRSVLVSLEQARRALALARPPGRPPGAKNKAARALV